jgi:hypothetical protein
MDIRYLATAIPDLRGLPEATVVEYYGGLPEATVVEYYGGNPKRAPVLRLDGKHENDPKIGKSVPLEVVETSS